MTIMTKNLREENIVIIVIIVTERTILAKGHFVTLPNVQRQAPQNEVFSVNISF